MTAGSAQPATSGKLDRAAVADSILRNLQLVLNSRAGCCETRRDYGMPDFNDVAARFSDVIPVITRAIKTQIENFEPRLSGVGVRHVPEGSNPLSLSFQIAVTLTFEDGTERLSFQTDLDDGQFRVRN
jgi:type VI secretion system protein